ncbi:fungal-specific transcription factor domain-containing protein [Thelonectria olida]|uniref:Fungal-specific transcription factor domain-containing protein n=1 Tax=Thelonectria olida TaxID=1576542 RepID=A0A9P9ASR5_9HYPO|nr:fungal-specific transcription factor domain-containing protein [Thelonectria olida]
MEQSESNIRKRVSNACQRCRKQKIKCSGTKPCRICRLRGQDCQFGSDEKKVLVSESALSALRRRVAELEAQQQQQRSPSSERQQTEDGTVASSQDPVAIPSSDTNQELAQRPYATPRESEPGQGTSSVAPSPCNDSNESNDDPAVENPLVPERPAYHSDGAGRLRYMGHSSTWSFSRQVIELAYSKLHASSSPTTYSGLDGDTYQIFSDEVTPPDAWSFTGLPSLDLSLFYLQTVKFRTHPLFHLFDETEFTDRLRSFYQSPRAYAQAQRIWYTHFLILMAFGKTLVNPKIPESGPAGSELFARAMKILPDMTHLCRDSVEATEIFCCIALYLQSIDHRSAAYVYVGQAVRMAHNQGLHHDSQPEAVGYHLVHRSRCIWWTVYTLDRRFSSSMGVPNSVRDEEMTTTFPSLQDDVMTTALKIHVKIGRLLGHVASTIYSSRNELKKKFVPTARVVLTSIGDLAQELSAFSDRCFGEISRLSSHLNLAYHQCIILTSRPVLFHLLKQHLQSPETSNSFLLSPSIKGLVRVCLDSAVQVSTILSQLKQYDLLDIFFPFDLESAFSAAFVLIMASSINKSLFPNRDALTTILEVFDYIASKGNALACARKIEVEELMQALGGLDSSRADNTALVSSSLVPQPMVIDHSGLPSLNDISFSEWNGDAGLSASQMMDLAGELDVDLFEDLWAV